MTPLTRLQAVRLRVAQRLEAGAWDGAAARLLSGAWSEVSSRAVARSLTWPKGVRLVAVGGSTLGGSGKTPLAIACARALGARVPVVFVAHGYRARAGEPRVVRVDDDVAMVGDEALVAARVLDGVAQVVVAASRQAAVDYASRLAGVLVVDGVLQTAPRRASLSLLALDGDSPWGAGAVPPRGDLRAPAEALMSACDRSVLLADEHAMLDGAASRRHDDIARFGAYRAHQAGRILDWTELTSARVGVFLALARPARLLAALARRGITPAHVVVHADHGGAGGDLAERFAAARCDVWLASSKCATHLESARIPHARLEYDVTLPPSLRASLGEAIGYPP